MCKMCETNKVCVQCWQPIHDTAYTITTGGYKHNACLNQTATVTMTNTPQPIKIEAQILGVDIATGWKMLVDMKHKGQAGGSAFGAELFAEEFLRRLDLYRFYSDMRGLMTPGEIIREMLHELKQTNG